MTKYIECEAAVNAVLNLAPKVDDDGYCWVIRGDAARAIDSIQAADVRPVEWGKWTVDKSGYPTVVCSVCGVRIPIVAGWCMDAHINYCPNCGADMRPTSMSGANEEES